MGTYSGTYSADTITPDFVSAGVGRDPAGSTPSASADTINGFGGNDILDGGGGGDTINGGDGADTIDDGRGSWGVANAGNIIHGNGGDDVVSINIYDTGADNPVGNIVYGDEGNDTVAIQIGGEPDYPMMGDIMLYGGAGSDSLEVQSFLLGLPEVSVSFYGEAGADVLKATRLYCEFDPNYCGTAADKLYGGIGDDKYLVYEPEDAVIEQQNQGSDEIIVYQSDYTLPVNVEKLQMTTGDPDSRDTYLGAGNGLDNLITVGDSLDYVRYALDGVGGNDVIYGSLTGDTVDGGAGNDTLYGKPLGENRDANDDADTIHGGTGNDLIYGSGGDNDTWDGDDLLYGDDGNDRIFGSYGDDQMYGGTGVDELGGQAGNDTMYGGAGNDKLGGGSGDDWLYGEADADVLSGRGGLDRLSGGPGNDIFDYDAVTDSKGAARDVILDFAGVGAAVGDRIDLSTIDANATAGGNQAFKFIGKAGFSGPGQVRVVASGADTLIQVNTDANKATVEMDILVKDGTATPTQWVAGDFIL